MTDEEITREFREKIFKHKLNNDNVWGKTYLKTVVADTETLTWTYGDEKIEVEVDADGHLCIADDNRWVFVYNIKALELIKEAVDIAIKKQNETI